MNNISTKNMKIMVFGDSITSTDPTSSRYTWMNFAPILMGIDKKNVKNYAIGGATYVYGRNNLYETGNGGNGPDDNPQIFERRRLFNQIQQALIDKTSFVPDIIILSLGTNDVKHVATNKGNQIWELKNIDDTYENALAMELSDYEQEIKAFEKAKTDNPDVDKYDLYDANINISNLLHHSLKYAMHKLRVAFPYAKCFVSTPIQRRDREQPTWLREAIIKMANRYNFIVMDAEFESGIIREDNQMSSGGAFSLTTDGLHPGLNGAKRLADFYANKIIKHIFIDIYDNNSFANNMKNVYIYKGQKQNEGGHLPNRNDVNEIQKG